MSTPFLVSLPDCVRQCRRDAGLVKRLSAEAVFLRTRICLSLGLSLLLAQANGSRAADMATVISRPLAGLLPKKLQCAWDEHVRNFVVDRAIVCSGAKGEAKQSTREISNCLIEACQYEEDLRVSMKMASSIWRRRLGKAGMIRTSVYVSSADLNRFHEGCNFDLEALKVILTDKTPRMTSALLKKVPAALNKSVNADFSDIGDMLFDRSPDHVSVAEFEKKILAGEVTVLDDSGLTGEPAKRLASGPAQLQSSSTKTPQLSAGKQRENSLTDDALLGAIVEVTSVVTPSSQNSATLGSQLSTGSLDGKLVAQAGILAVPPMVERNQVMPTERTPVGGRAVHLVAMIEVQNRPRANKTGFQRIASEQLSGSNRGQVKALSSTTSSARASLLSCLSEGQSLGDTTETCKPLAGYVAGQTLTPRVVFGGLHDPRKDLILTLPQLMPLQKGSPRLLPAALHLSSCTTSLVKHTVEDGLSVS